MYYVLHLSLSCSRLVHAGTDLNLIEGQHRRVRVCDLNVHQMVKHLVILSCKVLSKIHFSTTICYVLSLHKRNVIIE